MDLSELFLTIACKFIISQGKKYEKQNKNQNEEDKPNYVDMEQTAFKMTYQKQEWIF